MRTSLVIATRGRPNLLRETLQSLRQCDPRPDELILVDGDERQSARIVVEEHCAAGDSPPARYLSGTVGLTLQRNRGLDAAEGSIVVFCDDDVELRPDAFGKLFRAFDEVDVVGASGRVIERGRARIGSGESPVRRLSPGRRRQGTMAPSGFPRRLIDPTEARDLEFLSGCFMAARRDTAVQVRFDEKLSGYALAEDEDFGYRLSRLGRLKYVPDAVLVHKVTGLTTTDQRAFNQMLVKNRAYLFRKNFPQTHTARFRFLAMIVVLAIHRTLNREWAGLRGLVEGAWQLWVRRAA